MADGNILTYSLSNRLIVPNANNLALIRNSEESLANNITAAAEKNKNLLYRKKEDGSFSTVQEYLEKLAKESFNIEYSIYRKIDEQIAEEINKAYDNTPYYLKKKSMGTTIGQLITNVFYGIGKNQDEQLFQLLQVLSNINTNELIDSVEVKNEKIVGNFIAEHITNLMKTAKQEKNTASSLSDSEAKKIFDTVFDENRIMNYIQTEDLSSKEKKQIQSDVIKKLEHSADFKALSRQERMGKIKELALVEEVQWKDIMDFMVSDFFENIWQDVQPYLKKGITKKTFYKVIREIMTTPKKKSDQTLEAIAEENGFAYGSKGASRKKDEDTVYSLAAFRINTDKISEIIAPFVIKQDAMEINNKLQIINLRDQTFKEEIDDIILSHLQTYHEALQKYMYNKGYQNAWNYYQKNFLAEVIALVHRDSEDDKRLKETVSDMHSEIKKGAEAIETAKTLKDTINKVQFFLDSKETIDVNEVLDIAKKFLNKDAKDAEELVKIEGLLKKSETVEVGIQKLIDRLSHKKSGYIANFNGSIGEIFITAIESVVFKDTDVNNFYQKGSTKNVRGQSAHADITMGNVGIQAKVYDKDDIKLYSDTTIHFNTDDALRYLRTSGSTSKTAELNDELTAFRFFLLNNTILKEVGIQDGNSDQLFLNALNLRLENFIRYSDGLSLLGDIKNNFYLINFHVVPASVIFLKMAEMFSEVNKSLGEKLIVIDRTVDEEAIKNYSDGKKSDDDYLLNNYNVLKLLAKTSATFKSFTLSLSELGIGIF